MTRRFALSIVLLAVVAVSCAAQNPTPTPAATSGALIVWIAEGATPDNRVSGSPSQVAALLPDGTVSTLIELDGQTNAVQRCTSQPVSADGRRFAFFVSQPSGGVDRGTLYQITDLGAPQVIGAAHKLTCVLDNFGYSPDGARLAYIDFPTYNESAENLTGTLRVFNAETADEQSTFERAAAFTLRNSELMYLQFFPNANSEVDEVAVAVWDGSASREVGTITARANCRYSGGRIAPLGEGSIAVLLGERCRGGDGRTRWQIYLVDRASRSSTLILSDTQSGGYFPATQTYNLYTATDGSTAVFSVADGLARDTAAIYMLDLQAEDASPAPVVSRAAQMRRYVPLRYSLGEFAPAARSADDRYWAVAVNPPGSAELAVIDLAAVDGPIIIPISRAGDAVRAMGFAPDSSRLVYVAGGTGGADTSLYHLDLEMGVESRIARGQYAPAIAVRADGAAALIQYRMTNEARPRVYVDLVLVEADGAQRDLLGGVVLDEQGFLDDFQFVVPLAWR